VNDVCDSSHRGRDKVRVCETADANVHLEAFDIRFESSREVVQDPHVHSVLDQLMNEV